MDAHTALSPDLLQEFPMNPLSHPAELNYTYETIDVPGVRVFSVGPRVATLRDYAG